MEVGPGFAVSQVRCVVTVGVSLLVLLIEYDVSFYCCGELRCRFSGACTVVSCSQVCSGGLLIRQGGYAGRSRCFG